MTTTERPNRFRSFILVGAPGAGKGTQGAILGQIPRFFHFSTGAAFRKLDTRTDIGQEFIQYSSRGELVPDELTIRFFRSQMEALAGTTEYKPDIDFLILDGIPRNCSQARLLEEHLKVLQIFHLSCPDRRELITRIRKRTLKSGRMDDASEDVIRSRIQTYEEETKELFDFYPDEIRCDINADQQPVKVLNDILEVILNHPEWLAFSAGEV